MLQVSVGKAIEDNKWTKIVYRGFGGVTAKEYPVGQVFYWPSFVSTTTNPKVASGFGGLICAIELSESFPGAQIKEHSHFPSEEEILLPPYTQFKVTESDEI